MILLFVIFIAFMKNFLSITIIVLFFLWNPAVYARENYDQYFEKMQSIDYENTQLTLVSWDTKVEYISNNYNIKKADAIKITSWGKTQILPGLFDPKDPKNKERIECFLHENTEDALKKQAWEMCMPTFWGFIKFSPSKYYIEYIRNGWEYAGVILMDTASGKTILQIDGPSFTGWTQDRKQFIYGGSPGISSDVWLYITKRGQFPSVKKILDDPIDKAFISKNLIFIQTYKLAEWYDQPAYKVVDLRNWKVLYSKKWSKSNN